jgi:hypothetical protein
VFEDKALADQAVVAVEKVVHHEDMGAITGKSKAAEAGQVEIVEAVPSSLDAPKSKV